VPSSPLRSSSAPACGRSTVAALVGAPSTYPTIPITAMTASVPRVNTSNRTRLIPFRFRHALIREAAYTAVSKRLRSSPHRRHAAWLTEMAADRAGEFDEILGATDLMGGVTHGNA
jgi:predicted ATPase